MNVVSIVNFIFVGCIFVCIAYDLVQRGILEKMPPLKPEAKTDLILAILGAYVLTATLRLDQIDRNLQNVLPSPANQYDRALRDYSSFLQAGSRNRQITFSNRYESMAALLRSIDTSRRSYEALNLYTSGWNGEMKDVYAASVAAVRRKVYVWRCFVVRDQYVKGEFEAQMEAMEKQYKEGINVFWVRESDLNKMPYFRENPVRSMALVDSEWLLVDTSPADRNSSPTETRVTWITDEVAQNPFSQLKTYGYIRPFRKTDLVRLNEEVSILKEN
jgi:hypothetical protein